MPSRIPITIRRLRPATPRRGYRPPERPEVPAPAPRPPLAPEARAREAGGPEDSAHYTCTCGMVFQAPVSASVACPHCGTAQDW